METVIIKYGHMIDFFHHLLARKALPYLDIYI